MQILACPKAVAASCLLIIGEGMTLIMNITGIIAEYNPFHNGHAYQLKCAKERTGADYIIILMSGNFVQRGAPALMDKYARAKMALLEGADLVIELPALWSTASAEYFASAGVALLDQLGCVDSLCYGCETLDVPLFSKICDFLTHETDDYKKQLFSFLKEGANYALAREKAIQTLLKGVKQADLSEVLKNPNNILALEYQKAIKASHSSISPYPILRVGEKHHSANTANTFVSASAIRNFLASCKSPASALPSDTAAFLQQAMPLSAFAQLSEYLHSYPLLYENDCSQMLHYCLLEHAASGFSCYADIVPDFSHKICRNMDSYTNFTDFCALLKSKDLAYTRISRALVHILLDIRQDAYSYWKERSYIPYARVLGFKKSSKALLTHIKKHAALPLLTRAKDAKKMLSKESLAFFEKGIFADDVYRSLLTGKCQQILPGEYYRQIVTI